MLNWILERRVDELQRKSEIASAFIFGPLEDAFRKCVFDLFKSEAAILDNCLGKINSLASG